MPYKTVMFVHAAPEVRCRNLIEADLQSVSKIGDTLASLAIRG